MFRRLALLTALAALSACGSVVPQGSAPQQRAVRQSTQAFTPSPEAQACYSGLGLTRANFTPLPDQYFGAGCSAVSAVRLSALRSDDATLGVSNLDAVACPLAQTFAAWARFGVDRAARQILGSPLVRIETMGSYSCRTVAGRERMSAHATANAIDVSAFVLGDGRRISVSEHWNAGSPEERLFLTTIHASACKRFGTVLGPAYNAAHRDHLHVEPGSGRFCR
ncbi:extensin family protein [Novosphingobium sp. TH158]|uniref:extensin family protein n=1 Tax=Novosphingobium sp. TH158 TaxID=2067455 RepID=UPI000C7A2428|nr:extensin family protein [Novosphingobium sp. TH158]PLK27678.1 extensin [Novosphingobium sp. TH158]